MSGLEIISPAEAVARARATIARYQESEAPADESDTVTADAIGDLDATDEKARADGLHVTSSTPGRSVTRDPAPRKRREQDVHDLSQPPGHTHGDMAKGHTHRSGYGGGDHAHNTHGHATKPRRKDVDDDAPPKASSEVTLSDKQADDGGTFAAFKDVNGAWRWAATFSNNFLDRDGETFTARALEDYEAYCDRTKDFPALQLWHLPGSEVGRADMIAVDDGMALATGTFARSAGDVAEALSRSKDLGVSHGYTYGPADLDRDGAYHRFRTFEISILPSSKAANLGTSFEVLTKEQGMNAEKRQWLVEKIGEERTKAIEAASASARKDLLARGVAWKEADAPSGDPASPYAADLGRVGAGGLGALDRFAARAGGTETLHATPLQFAAQHHEVIAAEVAQELNLSRQRVYQLLNEGPQARDRVRAAVASVLTARGIPVDEAAIRAFETQPPVPPAKKEQRSHASPYVADFLEMITGGKAKAAKESTGNPYIDDLRAGRVARG